MCTVLSNDLNDAWDVWRESALSISRQYEWMKQCARVISAALEMMIIPLYETVAAAPTALLYVIPFVHVAREDDPMTIESI